MLDTEAVTEDRETAMAVKTERCQRRAIGMVLIAFLLMQSEAAFGWGNEGHTASIGWLRRKYRPRCRSFLRAAVEIAYLGPEPDRWRSASEFALKNAQEPDHFIDLERVSWLDPLPRGRYEFYRKLYEKRAATTESPDDYLPEHVGLQPYITMEVYGRMKAALREYRQRRAAHQPTQAVQHAIVFYAGWLGHYVADGSQPLHTTIQYNGWVGANPNGYTTEHKIHSQFETAYVAANITDKDFVSLVKSPDAGRGSVCGVPCLSRTVPCPGRKGVRIGEGRELHGEGIAGGVRVHDGAPGRRIADAAEPVVHGVDGECGAGGRNMRRRQLRVRQ